VLLAFANQADYRQKSLSQSKQNEAACVFGGFCFECDVIVWLLDLWLLDLYMFVVVRFILWLLDSLQVLMQVW